MNTIRDVTLKNPFNDFKISFWRYTKYHANYKDILAKDTLDATKEYVTKALDLEWNKGREDAWNRVKDGFDNVPAPASSKLPHG